MDYNGVFGKVWEIVSLYGLKVIVAIIILIVGRWAAIVVRNVVKGLMLKAKVDQTITRFVGNLTYAFLMVFIVIAALNQLGIQTTSFVAILGAAGLAIGLALQGSLANFAAGFLMILFKPFRVGDYIEGGGVTGTVEEIQIFTTTLMTPDNKTVIVPNSKMTGDNIVNYTCKGTRRVDLIFSINYKDDSDKAKQIITGILAGDPRILKDPLPQVGFGDLAESAVKLVVRPWTKSEDYWAVYGDTIESVKKAFDANGFSVPYPQREVHIHQQPLEK
jgi:small conductance mechanosensitive channel